MIFRQFVHDDLGCASYVIGDEHAGIAAVVDPKLEIDDYLAFARYVRVSIEHVLESHNHADHVSGHGRLAAATGATIHVHREAEVDYEHEPFDDGWELELGTLRVRAMHTPGHRPEHTAFALVDTARGEEPWAVLTGDTLFVGDIARPDLAVEKEDGARAIFHSLHDTLLTLAPSTEVWPAHLGGSLCGGPGMDMKISSTVGYEAAHNELLSESDEARFVERAIASLAPQPPNYKAIVEINRGPLDRRAIEAVPLTPRQVQQGQDEGTLIVDVRTAEQFDDAHIHGAVAITILEAGFGSKLAWVADRDKDIVVVGRDDEDARRAIALGAAVGLRNFGGFLSGGMTAWRQDKRETRRIERLRLDELRARRAEDPDLQVIDVRETTEWDAGHVAGTLHRPYHDLHALPADVDPDRPVAAVCASGARAATAASLLSRFGAQEVIHVVDSGVPAWLREYPDEGV